MPIQCFYSLKVYTSNLILWHLKYQRLRNIRRKINNIKVDAVEDAEAT
jgi:hypothetical protein